MVKESLTVKASVTTLTAKVETLTKNIEQQKQTEKELQVSKLLWNAIIFIQCYSCLIQQKEGTDCEKMRG